MVIKIKYHDKDLQKIEKLQQGDWLDLRSAEDVHLNIGDFKIISLGISMKIPEGYEAHIVPRSSTFKKWGLLQVNSLGIVDSSYSGNSDVYMFPAYCLRGKKVSKDDCEELSIGDRYTEIKVGDKICQFRIMKKQPEIQFEEVEFMEDKDRGGFGSTDSK